MKIGGEYIADKIRPKHFEHLAEEAGLSKPMVKQRVPELAEIILSKIPEVTPEHRQTTEIAEFIRDSCDRKMRDFRV